MIEYKIKRITLSRVGVCCYSFGSLLFCDFSCSCSVSSLLVLSSCLHAALQNSQHETAVDTWYAYAQLTSHCTLGSLLTVSVNFRALTREHCSRLLSSPRVVSHLAVSGASLIHDLCWGIHSANVKARSYAA